MDTLHDFKIMQDNGVIILSFENKYIFGRIIHEEIVKETLYGAITCYAGLDTYFFSNSV